MVSWTWMSDGTLRIESCSWLLGQLEFVGGGWVQNDDASTHYTAMMDQLTYGWLKIDDYFGEAALPKTGWQIDCFGYSQEQAAVFDQVSSCLCCAFPLERPLSYVFLFALIDGSGRRSYCSPSPQRYQTTSRREGNGVLMAK